MLSYPVDSFIKSSFKKTADDIYVKRMNRYPRVKIIFNQKRYLFACDKNLLIAGNQFPDEKFILLLMLD